MKKWFFLFFMLPLVAAAGEVAVTSVTARQRNSWSGLVDIVVTIQGESNDVAEAECAFVATNTATQSAIPVGHITRNGDDTGSGNVWTRKFVWDAFTDVGAVKMDDVLLAVDAKILGGVQLWEGGPYWAECNVGATRPEEYGYYFYWGDTVGYILGNVGWDAADGSQIEFSFSSKSCPAYGKSALQLQSEGYIDAERNIMPKHDAARAHFGEPWRMPTKDELSHLLNNCDAEWTARNGVNGLCVKGRGKYSSRSVFIPAASSGLFYSCEYPGFDGYVWSSTWDSSSGFHPWCLAFGLSNFVVMQRGVDYGQSVRPVRRKGDLGRVDKGVETHLALDCTLVGKVIVTSVSARQRYPWNGLVDVTVTLQGEADDLLVTECTFAAMNSATKEAIPVEHITRNGDDTGADGTWTRKFIWDAKTDVGAMMIDDVALTVNAKTLGVQLWKGGPCWAECNVGATNPEECGYYFWWGDTVGYRRNASNNGWVSVKDETGFLFSYDNCPTYCNSNSQLESEGYIDATGNLAAAHDAATAHLGVPWRMPTDAEFSELISNCTTTWTTRNGVYGRLVTGKGEYSLKSIFLPASGYGYDSNLDRLGSYGRYWSSSGMSGWAGVLYFGSDYFSRDYIYRDLGHPVRPVRGFANNNSLTDGGWTTHLSLDCREGAKVADSTHPIVYDASWFEDGTTAKITANGQKIVSGRAGTYAWAPSTDGVNLLTLNVYNDSDEVVGTERVWFLSREDLTELVIPDGTTEIGEYAFAGGQFTSVTIPNSVTNVAATAFAGCTNIAAVTVPSWVNVASVFAGSKDKVEHVAISAQGDVPESAYAGCSALKRVDVVSLADWLTIRFANAEANPLHTGAALYVGGKEATELAIPEGTTEIGEYAFAGGRFTSVTIPDSVTNAAATAFVGCSNIVEVTLGDSFSLCNSGLLHRWSFNGSLEDTVGGCAATVVGAVTTDGACFKTPGGSSGSAYIDLGDDLVPLGVDAVTIELWATQDSSTSYARVFDFGSMPTGYNFSSGNKGCYSHDNIRMYWSTSSVSSFDVTRAWSMNVGQQYHMAVVFQRGANDRWTVTYYVQPSDGGAQTTVASGMAPEGWSFGDVGRSEWLLGQALTCWDSCAKISYDEVRISKVALTQDEFEKRTVEGSDQVELDVATSSLNALFPSSYNRIQAVRLNEGTKSIAGGMFANCASLEAIDIPCGVTSIGGNAFAGCTSLEAFAVPPNVTRIGADAFLGCNAIKRVDVASIDQWMLMVFENEKANPLVEGAALYVNGQPYGTGASVVDGLTILDGWVVGCEDPYVAEIVVPEGVVGIGRFALADLYDLETIRLPSTLKYIASGAFARDSYLDEVEIPDSVVRIDAGAFEDCSWMQTISVGRGVERVGSRAFAGCTKLARIRFEDGLTEIGDCAFSNCWRMMSASLPLSVANVAATAFKDCDSLTGVNVPTSIAPLSQWFAPVYRQIKDVTIPSGEALICGNMFKGCSSLVSVDIPEGVTNIGGSAFEDCVNLPSVELPSSLQSVGEGAFRNCDALTAIGLPDAVCSVGAYAFYDCYRLKDVSLSKNLESLPDHVFDACPQLDSIYVPASVTQLGSRIFGGAMSAVYFIGNAPAYGANVYASTGSGLVTYVKYGTKGWDGRPNSRDLPQSWPTDNSYGRSIMTWDPVQFDVTFDAGEGAFYPVESQTYSCEQIMYTAYSLPPFNPVRKGYKFAGWWTEAVGGAEVTPSTGVTSDRPHTLYAHWDESFIVTVRFNACGGTVLPNEIEYTAEVPFGTLPVPTREHYIFTGWYTAASGGSIVRVSTEVPKADRELFAHWSPAHYTIRFNANNGTGATATQGFIYGQDVTLRANGFSCSGCEFVGWSLTPGGEAVYADGKTISGLAAIEDGVIDLYAVWTGNVYAVRFDSHGGLGVMPNQTFVLGVPQKLSHCTFTRSGYVFKGWALSTTAEVSYGDGEEVCNLTASKNATVVLFAVWGRDPQGDWTVEEYLNCANLTFTLGGDTPLWYGEKVARADKVGMMRSGAIGDSQANWIETVVSGAGQIGFWWKASGEYEVSKKGVITRYDYAEFTIDGALVEEIGDESDWTYVTVAVEGSGSHVLRWMYHKDESGSDGDDCAWLSEVSWEPTQVAEPIPELPENPTAEDVQSALAGSADSTLLAHVTDAATYNAYREWALKIGATDVKASPFAWASFVTDSAALLAKMPTDDDLKVEEFKPAATAGSFDFTVSVKDVKIGDKASVDNLKKLFGLEGAESLDSAAFSSENVSLDFKEPQDGKLKFAATPAVDNAKSFFMKVKVK